MGMAVLPVGEAAIEAVDLGEALAGQPGRRLLAGMAVVADHHQGRLARGLLDEGADRVVVQASAAGNMALGEALWVADINQGEGLVAFEPAGQGRDIEMLDGRHDSLVVGEGKGLNAGGWAR